MAATRAARERIDGVLVLDKPAGMTSKAALQAARRLFNAAKAGHTGTLDPLASGLLPLCFGEATKFAGELLAADKTYRAVLRLGIRTSTGDAEGEVVSECTSVVSRADFELALERYRGAIEQVPPRFSALKHQGRKLYEYARAGIDVPLVARAVTIHELVLEEWNPPCAAIRVVCSKGTYIRALADDLGEDLRCGAHLAALRRTAIGRFDARDACTLEQLAAMDAMQRRAALRHMDALVREFPALHLSAELVSRLRFGQTVAVDPKPEDGIHRLYDAQGSFIGLGEAGVAGVHPRRLVAATAPE